MGCDLTVFPCVWDLRSCDDSTVFAFNHDVKNTKVYLIGNMQAKAIHTLLHVALCLYEYMHDKCVVSESCGHVATVRACVHLCDCFPVEGHIYLKRLN